MRGKQRNTCNGLVDLCKSFLTSGFTTAYLENEFGKLRGAGGAYFITVQNLIEKFHVES